MRPLNPNFIACLGGRSRAGGLPAAALLGSLHAAFACADARIDLAWPSGADTAFLVLVPAEWRGAVGELEIEGPLQLDAVPRVNLEAPAGARVFAVAVDGSSARRADARIRAPSLWRLGERSSELSADERCLAEGWLHQDTELELPVPSPSMGVTVFEAELDAARFAETTAPIFGARLGLRAPLEACFGGRELVLSPFAEDTRPEAARELYEDVQLLDEETVLVWSGGTVEVVRRGSSVAERRVLSLSELALPAPDPREGWRLGPARLFGDGARARGVVAVSRSPVLEGPAVEGRVFELVLELDRLRPGRELWRTLEPTRASPQRLAAADFDAAGRWVAVGEGLVLTATAPGAAPLEIPQSGAFDGLYARATGDPARPFLVGGRTFVWWFDPSRGPSGFTRSLMPLLSTGPARVIDGVVAARTESGLGLSLVLSPLELARLAPASNDWSYQVPRATAAPAACAHQQRCGRAFLAQRCEFTAGWPTAPHTTSILVPFRCGNVYLTDEAAGCSVSVPFEPGSDIEGNIDERKLTAAASFGDRVVLAGERGRILELELR